MTDVFVSYKREDRDFVSALVPMLEGEGFAVWWDDAITPRTAWDAAIEQAIGDSACVLVLWSARSVGSQWVNTEAHYANDRGKLVPVKIEPCELPLAFVLNQHLDLSGWGFDGSDRRWRKLLAWLADFRDGPAAGAAGGGAAAGKPSNHAEVGTFASGEPIVDGEFVSHSTPSGTLFRDAPGLPVMRVVPAGSCTIGALPNDGAKQAWEEPQRNVTIARPLAMSAFPVLGGEYTAILPPPAPPPPPPVRKGLFGRAKAPPPPPPREVRPELPMGEVSAADAQEFCRRLGEKTGHTYRLPSEAEWEYACRAGSRDVFHCGGDLSERQACFARPRAQGASVPGRYPANAFGLFDMEGNIREWTQDYWHDSLAELPADGRPRTDGHSAMRVTRGGAWSDPKSALRCSARGRAAETMRSELIGFRVVREL